MRAEANQEPRNHGECDRARARCEERSRIRERKEHAAGEQPRHERDPPFNVAALRSHESAEDAADAGDTSVEGEHHRSAGADERAANQRRNGSERHGKGSDYLRGPNEVSTAS